MLKKGLLLYLLLALQFSPCGAQSRCTLHRVPDSVVLKRKLLPGRYLDPASYGSSDFLAGLSRWIDEMHAAGYLEARIDSFHADSLSCQAWVFTGTRYSWGLIRTDSLSSEALQRAGVRPGRVSGAPLRWTEWVRLNDRVIRYYENSGYPFARSGLTGVKLGENRVSGLWAIDTGPYFGFDSLVIEGTARIHPGVMRRHLELLPGRPYQEKHLSSISGKIRELPYIREIKGAETEFYTGRADVYVYLEKQPASRFNGVLGLLPGSRDNGGWLLTGDVDIDLRNAFAQGERTGVRWRRMDEASQELKLHAAFPYLFRSPAGIQMQFDMVKRDTSYLNLLMHAGITVREKSGGQVRFFFRRAVSSAIALSSPFPDIRNSMYGLGYTRANLDHALFPSRGWRIEASASAGNRRIEDPAESTNAGSTLWLEGEWQAEGYIPAGRSFTVVCIHRGGYRNSFEEGSPAGRLFENEMFRLGGYGSIRGFDEDALLAERFAFLTLEGRYLFEERSWLHIFAEGGWLACHDGTTRRGDTPYGLGAGMTLNTGSGMISLSLALGSRQGNPLQFGETRMHIGFQGLF